MSRLSQGLLLVGLALGVQLPAHAAREVTYRVAYDYDELGRVIRERRTGADAQEVVAARHEYDSEGRLVKTVDALGRTVQMNYDVHGRVTGSTDAAGSVGLAYDAGGRVSEVTDPRGLKTRYQYDGFGQLWRQDSPDTGVTQFTYDAAGRLTRTTRNDGSEVVYAYDGAGRLLSADAGTLSREFEYDSCASGLGRLCLAATMKGSELRDWVSHAYTPQGWLVERRYGGIDGNGIAYEDAIGYVYDGLGRVTTLHYPGGASVAYAYAQGRLSGMTATSGGSTRPVVGQLAYQPFGPAEGWAYGNGLSRHYAYDLNRRAIGISAGDGGPSLVQSLTYGFNDASEITAVTNAVDATLSQRYAYDGIGRLEAELNHGRGWEYDASGNRDRDSRGSQATTYTIDPASNRVLGSSGPSGVRRYDYDVLGNRIGESGAGRTASYGYDAFGRLEQAEVNGQAVAYTVNALGQRVRKEASAKTRYVYNGQNQLLAERTGGVWKRYLWLGGELVGVLASDNGLYYVHADHLGRPEVVTDGANQVAWRARNEDPYGARQVVVDRIEGLNLGFAGQYHDAETGLWYNGFRDYDASVGRYLQSDPIGLAAGVNTYVYVAADPVGGIDPLGLSAVGYVGGWIGGDAVVPDPSDAAWPKWAIYGLALGGAWALDHWVLSKQEDQGAQAPGMPTADDGYVCPKNWDGEKVRSPNGRGYGWPDNKGNVWVPTGPGSGAHGGPHWDVQKSGGGYINVYPGGRTRGGR